jgi:hypothetical protein
MNKKNKLREKCSRQESHLMLEVVIEKGYLAKERCKRARHLSAMSRKSWSEEGVRKREVGG